MDTSAELDDERALILQAPCVLHANGQSTAMTHVAVDRLNRGMCTAVTLIPTWDAVFVRDANTDRLVQLMAAQPIDMSMRRVAAVMRTVDDIERGSAGSRELRAVLSAAARMSPAPTPVFVVACAAGAAGLSLVDGAPHWSIVAMVAAVAGLGGLVRRALLRVHVGILGQSFAAALLAGTAEVVVSRLDPHAALGLVAVCPAIVLVPGHLGLSSPRRSGATAFECIVDGDIRDRRRWATAALVVACMAVGLTVPTRIRDALIARRERRIEPSPHRVRGATPATLPPDYVGEISECLHYEHLAHGRCVPCRPTNFRERGLGR